MESEFEGHGRRAKLICTFDPVEADVLGNAARAESLTAEGSDETILNDGIVKRNEDGSASAEVIMAWAKNWVTETRQSMVAYQLGMLSALWQNHRRMANSEIEFTNQQIRIAYRLGVKFVALADQLDDRG